MRCEPGGAEVDLGAWQVTADLQENTCGAQADDFPQRFTFRVSLAQRNGVLEWRPEGAAGAQGPIDLSTGAFRVTQELEMMVAPPDRRIDFVGCVVQRTDVIDGVAPLPPPDGGAADAALRDATADGPDVLAVGNTDAGVADVVDGGVVDGGVVDGGASLMPGVELVGTETIAYGAVGESDCRGLIGAAPGQVLTLPCSVRYRFSGRRP